MRLLERRACFGGLQQVWEHDSQTLACPMRLAVYLPPAYERGPCPTLYWLSGLTCTEQNFITKAGAQRAAAAHGVVLVAPDTSPRGPQVADDPAYDLGQGAGFYVNATQAPWAAHYQMFDYITQELPALIESSFNVTDARGVSGHSMGGHGALLCGLKRPERYRSVSAFSPIVAPSQAPWGHKALGAYLGQDPEDWLPWDACALVPEASIRHELLIDQGQADEFLTSQLMPELLQEACARVRHPLTLRMQPGYDHSYYFIASFIDDHMAHHAQALHA